MIPDKNGMREIDLELRTMIVKAIQAADPEYVGMRSDGGLQRFGGLILAHYISADNRASYSRELKLYLIESNK